MRIFSGFLVTATLQLLLGLTWTVSEPAFYFLSNGKAEWFSQFEDVRENQAAIQSAPQNTHDPGGQGGNPSYHDRDKAEKKEAKAAAKDKSMTLTGWIKDQDGKTMFMNDKDKQAWNISNMDAVKGHEGHHVKIRAKLNESDHSVDVEKVTMLRKSKQTSEEQKAEGKK
jgi:hypothetical protein